MIKGKTLTPLLLAGIFVLMLGLSFAAVPLYDLFCRVTGFGGTTQVSKEAPKIVLDKVVSVRFDTNVNNLEWNFKEKSNVIDVKVGQVNRIEFEVENLGNETSHGVASFNVSPASFGKYYSFIPNHTLAFTADGAFIDFRNVGDRLIVSERYYLGGPENLRGYKFARVSPRRTLSNGKFVRIGGNKYVYSAFEYLYPLALETGLKGILFIDVGETYEETQTIDLNPWDMKKDIGFGFRWLSPVGPLKLDFGFPLGNRESDESKFEVQFSFGSVFVF